MIDLLRTALDRLMAGDRAWLKEQAIDVLDKSGYWVLNYGRKDRTEYNRLFRGMVIRQGEAPDPLDLIVSFPFTRFLNHGEAGAAEIDFGKADMLEKMDGTLVCVTWDDGLLWHTRKMLSRHAPDMARWHTTFTGKKLLYMSLIGDHVRRLTWEGLSLRATYMFEFIDDASRVVTKYGPGHNGLYLLGARSLLYPYTELSEDHLDWTAKVMGVRRPRRWDVVNNFDEIQARIAEEAAKLPDFEGFVFRDRETDERVKVKSLDYVTKHHLIDDMTYRRLTTLYVMGEAEEIIAYRPQAKAMIDEIRAAHQAYLDRLVVKVAGWHALGLDAKALAAKLIGGPAVSKARMRVMAARREPIPPPRPKEEPDTLVANIALRTIGRPEAVREEADQFLRKIAMPAGSNLGCPAGFLERIGFQDEEIE